MVGALLDAEAEDGFINNLILSVRSLIPVEALVEEVERRNKLKMLNPFLEQLVSEGSKVGGEWGWWGWACWAGLPPLPQQATLAGCAALLVHGHGLLTASVCLLPDCSPTASLLPKQDPQVHNALGKIIIDTNNNPEHFLTTNPYYESLVRAAPRRAVPAAPRCATRPIGALCWHETHAALPLL